MAGKGKIQSGTFGSLPKTKQQQQQPTVFEQKKAAEDEKKYQQAYKTTGVSRTAYNNINKKKSASSSSTTTKKKSTSSRSSKASSSPTMIKRSPAAKFDTKTGAINLSNGTAIGGHTDADSPTARFSPTVKDIIEKNYNRAKNTIGISRAAYEALQTKEKQRRQQAEEQFKKDNSAGKWLSSNLTAGAAQFNKGLVGALDFITPLPFDTNVKTGERNAFGKWMDRVKESQNDLIRKAQTINENKGGAWNWTGQLLSGTVSSIPNLMLAVASGGTSAAGNLAQGASAAAGTSDKALKLAQSGMRLVESAAKNPAFWGSFTQTAGSSYNEAKERGESENVATVYALLNGAAGAAVELSGGLENMPASSQSKSKLLDVIKNALEEGNEEVAQSLIDTVLQQVTNKNKPEITVDGLIKDAAQNWSLGAGSAALLGTARYGAAKAAEIAADTADTYRTGKAINQAGAAQELIDAGKAAGENRAARLYAQKLDGKDKVSNMETGKLFKKTVQAAADEAALFSALQDKTGANFALRSDMADSENGRVNLKSREVDINPDGKTAVVDTAKHEVTHITENYAPKAYREYQSYIVKAAMSNNAQAVENRRQQLRSYGYADGEIDSELAAELSAPLVSNKAAIERLARTKPTFADKISDVISSAAAHVRSLGGNYVTDGGVELTYSQLHKAEQLWRNAVSSTQNGGNTIDRDGNVRHLFNGDDNISTPKTIHVPGYGKAELEPSGQLKNWEPDDVLAHYDMTRPNSPLSDSVRFSRKAAPEAAAKATGELDNKGVIRRSGTEAKKYVDGLVKEKGVDSPSELAPGTVTRAQSKTDIRRRRSFGARVRDLMSHAYTVVVDDMHPFWNYTKAAEKSLGREQFGADNPYKLAINSKDASSRAAYIITDKLIDYNNKEIGSGLIETLENNGITGDNYSDFNAYLVARHALEWLDPEAHGAVKQVYEQPELNDMDVVQAMIDDFERKNPDFKKAAEKLYDWQRTMLKSWLLDTGVISQEQYDKFTEMYPNYVPFFREKDTPLGSAPAGGFANQGNIFKEAEGSRRRIYDPVENIMYNVATYVNHASKHGVTSAAVRLYDMLDDDPDHNVLRQFWEEVEPIHPESDNPKYFKSKEKKDTAEQSSDAVAPWDSLADVTQEKENSISQTLREQMTVHDNIVTVMDGGKKRYFRVDDPALLSLLDNARPGRFDGFLALMASFSRVRAALITSFNPAFALASNPVRDLGTLVLNSSDINKAKVIGRAATSYVDVFKNSQAYKSYLSMGGQYSSVTTEGTDAMKKAMNKLRAKDPSTVKRIFKGIASSPAKVFGAYQTLGDAIEASPRMSEFKSTLDKGYDYHEAFYRAKDVTTNFSRGGKISKDLNAISNFFNAAIQGVDKFFRQGKNNPASFAMGIAVLTAIEAASWAWNTWNPFDDKDESYENLSNYTKNNFYTFYKGAGRFISFPKPRECAVLSTLIGASLQYCLNKQPERFRNFFSDYVIDQFIPDGSIAGYTTIQDLRANKDFMGRPIVPDNLAELPPELQYDDSTSYLARWTAGMVHKLPEFIRDDLIESPMQIDHIINSELGVLGKINRTYAAPKKDKFGMITFGLNTTLSKDSLFSTDNLTIFYDNKNHAAAQAKGYPSSDNSWLSNRYTQASQVLSVINKIYKNDPEGENARAVRLQYSHYAKQYKDNPLGYSDDVYKELKSLADLVEDDNGILSLPQVKETIERTVNKKKISYTFDNAQSVINYQMDLNESVDREFRKLFTQVEFNALSTEDKLNELKKAKEDATKTVKDFYIDTKGGKRMFDESTEAKPTFVKPAVEAVTQYQEQQAFMNSINTDRLAPIAEALAKAVPDKAEQYTAESFKYSEVDSKSFDGKKYKISGELKEKINTEAESEYYSNIDKLLNNQINVEDIVGLTGKGNTKTSENAAGDKVSLSGKMYNEDGSPRFDELVTAKIIKAAESNIKDVVLQRYKDEIIAGETAATAAPEETAAPEATAAPAEKRVFGMADVNRLSNTFAAAFKSGTDEQRRIFGLPDTVQPQRIAFGYAPPIGKSTTQTAAAPAAATPIVAPQVQAGTTAIASAAPTKSSGSKRVYSSTSRKSSGTSAKRSSGRSSGGYSSSSLGSSVRALLSPVAEAAEISPNIAAASAAYSQAMSPYERIKTSFGIGTADRMKGIYQHFLDMLYGGTTIGEIIPGLKSVDVSGKAVNVEQLRLADCDEPTRQAVMQALQAQAEKEAVNETL